MKTCEINNIADFERKLTSTFVTLITKEPALTNLNDILLKTQVFTAFIKNIN